MGHSIRAFISRRAAFDQVAAVCPVALVDLPQGLTLLAPTHELLSVALDGVRYRGARLSRWNDADEAFLKRLAGEVAVAYVETDYHGGVGKQGAIVAHRGEIVYGPRQGSEGPINAALRWLGVRPHRDDFDEFDTLQLRRFRDNGALVRAYYLRYWERAYFVLGESSVADLERAARRQIRLQSDLGPSGLYCCPVDQPPENVIESFLAERALAMWSFELSIEEHWMISSFYRLRRKVETEPTRFAELASWLYDEANVPFVIWCGREAARIARCLGGTEEDRREFASFYPYDIPGAHPPNDLVEAFPEKVGLLRDCLAATPPGAIGVLVNL